MSPDTPVVRHLWTTTKRRSGPPSIPPEPCPVFYNPRRARRRNSSGLDPDSERAIAAVQAGAPAAIAFQFPVSEPAILAFSVALADALGTGQPIEGAVTRGRLAVQERLPDSWEWAAPALYLGPSGGID